LAHSNSLGGEIFIALNGAASVAASASVDVVVWKAWCIHRRCRTRSIVCPTSQSLSSYFMGGSTASSPFAAGTHNNFSPVSNGSLVTYQADTAAAVLRDVSNQPVTFADAEAMRKSQYSHGVRSGVLFTDLNGAECSEGSGTYCETKASEQIVIGGAAIAQ